jgi:hypothetical protein
MRLFNFTISEGRVTVADLTTTSNLVVSGINGADALALDRKTGSFYGFSTHFGDSSDEDPYGNVRLYNSSVVNTSTELAMSQSFSAPITGSAIVSFVFVTDKNHRG